MPRLINEKHRVDPDTRPARVFYNIRDFCTSYDISRSHLYRLVQAGLGPRLTHLGDATRIHVDDAKEWADQRRNAPVEPAPRGGAKKPAPTISAMLAGRV
jgi:predicted DNA-binding transcriptional regulator AlpA